MKLLSNYIAVQDPTAKLEEEKNQLYLSKDVEEKLQAEALDKQMENMVVVGIGPDVKDIKVNDKIFIHPSSLMRSVKSKMYKAIIIRESDIIYVQPK